MHREILRGSNAARLREKKPSRRILLSSAIPTQVTTQQMLPIMENAARSPVNPGKFQRLHC